MTHTSKRKGSGCELEVVRHLQDRGLAAEKMPLSGALPNYSGDIEAVARHREGEADQDAAIGQAANLRLDRAAISFALLAIC